MHFHLSSYSVSLCIVDHFNGNIIFPLHLLQKCNWITFTKQVVDPESYKGDTSAMSWIISTIYRENLEVNEAIAEQAIMLDQNNQFRWQFFFSCSFQFPFSAFFVVVK